MADALAKAPWSPVVRAGRASASTPHRAGRRDHARCCARRKPFGPVAPVFRFETEAEAVALANDTEFGLASYFYSRDIGRIFRVAEALEYGMVGINTGSSRPPRCPSAASQRRAWGARARQGIDDYVETKYLCLGDILK